MSEFKSPENCCDPVTGCCSSKSTESNTNSAENETISINRTDQMVESSLSSNSVMRRDFIRYVGLGTAGLTLGVHRALGQYASRAKMSHGSGSTSNRYELQELIKRGKPEVYSGKELAFIGMPIGGICAGQVYLGGDGKLWLWDIFNDQKEGVSDKSVEYNGKKIRSRDGSNFVEPLTQEYPFQQEFFIDIQQEDSVWNKRLDFTGFSNIEFCGQYPLGHVTYREKSVPAQVELKAFSPFIPLDVDSSSYPATVMNFTITNTSDKPITCDISGILENPVLGLSDKPEAPILKNSLHKKKQALSLLCEADITKSDSQLSKQRDYGSICLSLYDPGDSSAGVENILADKGSNFPLRSSLTGKLTRTVSLGPKESNEVVFVIGWYFPNLKIRFGDLKGRSYSKRFTNALEVAEDLCSNLERLKSQTLLWVQTFYEDSTLPHWFLNRTFVNTSTLATETAYLLEDGRFWGWEGIGCCPGTCTHVWHYAQAVGRIFPELERNLRERTDFAVMKEDGKIDFRGGIAKRDAADGQAGVVLRSYREHQMCKDDQFLKQNWSSIKRALNYLIEMDKEFGESNGMIYGEQHNTLDAEWYGYIPVITSLYLAALSAGFHMAEEVGDSEFANLCINLLLKGQKNIESLFNGKYFVQEEDPNHLDAIGIGSGCYIDQVFGQSWAFQLGLGRLYNQKMIRSSLDALWKHNFKNDMGEYRKKFPNNINGRPYALSGDSGLVICTWPEGGKREDWEKHWQFGYFNECMTGFEYQVAGHMIWEDKILEGLSITRAIHDRYHPIKRNPYNEIECSDHYARAMASYGVYTAIGGFSYHGPNQIIGFDPKIQESDFNCAFVAAEGWGSFRQIQKPGLQTNILSIKNGKLWLKGIDLTLNGMVKNIKASLNSESIRVNYKKAGKRVQIRFNSTEIATFDSFEIKIEHS